MSRKIRSIAATTLLDPERAASLSDAAFRVWVGLRLLADDFGAFRAGAKGIAANIWQDTARTRDAENALAELAAAGFVQLYEVRGDRFGLIVGWDKEQRTDRCSERDRLPPPPDHLITNIQSLASDSAAVRGESPRFAADGGDSPESAASRDPFRSVPIRSEIAHARKERPKRGTVIPSDWQPNPETLDALRADGLDARSLVPEFVDYWLGVGKTRVDWEATFRGRIRTLAASGRVPAWQKPLKLAALESPEDNSPPADPSQVDALLANLPKFGGAA